MKILLTTLNAKYIHLNLAVRLLYDMNKNHEGLSWKEFTIKQDQDEIAGYCKDFDVIAFSCYIWNITRTLEVARKIKALNPGIKILLGGPEVSYEFDDVISRDEIDFIITGEGEIPFQQFIEHYPEVDNVPALVRKTNEGIMHNPAPAAFDLKNFADTNPYIHDPVQDLENKVLYIETSRGCPYKCEFCLASLDNRVRYLPAETIKKNLLYLMTHGRVIKFLDRTFNIKKDFTIEIFRFILEHHRPGNVFQFEITADIVHPDIVQFIKDHVPEGLFRFEIGIQTVNQKANLEVSRKQNFEKTSAVIRSLSDKIEMHLDLIVGLPLDRWNDVKFSIEEVFKLFAPELQLGFLKFLKGTPVRERYEQYGYRFDPVAPYQVIESNFLSKEELEQITRLEHALEIYWNKKRSVNTLRYITARYSIFDFLLGLGTYFGEVSDYHRHSLTDVYRTLEQYAEKHFPADLVMKELIAIDYLLYHKEKPERLFAFETVETGLTKQKQVMLPVSFDFKHFEHSGEVIPGPSQLVIQYNSSSKAVSFAAQKQLQA